MKSERLRTRAAACFVLAAVIGAAWADELIQREISRLKLRSEALVKGSRVTLADVLLATKADPRLMSEISDTPLLTGLTPPMRTRVTHAQVTEALVQAGVNMSRVLIGGSLSCAVELERLERERPEVRPGQQPGVNGAGKSAGEGATLAALLNDHIAAEFASLGGEPQVEFERGAESFIKLTSPPFDFSIRSPRSRRLGVREMTVIIRRDGRVQRTVRIGVSIRLSRRVVVAAKALNVGTFVRRQDLELEERIFDRLADAGLRDFSSLIGKQIKRYIPVSRQVTDADVKSVDLVKRSRPVTVLGAGGNISVRLTGVALDSGDLGDSVRVRIGDSRKDRRVLRGVVTGVGTVRLEGGAP